MHLNSDQKRSEERRIWSLSWRLKIEKAGRFVSAVHRQSTSEFYPGSD